MGKVRFRSIRKSSLVVFVSNTLVKMFGALESKLQQYNVKLDGVGLVDNRPSTAEAPPMGKIHPFSKIAVMQFGCSLGFRISYKRATVPVLTSDKEEKHVILPTTFNFVVRRGKLRSYTLQTPPEVF